MMQVIRSTWRTTQLSFHLCHGGGIEEVSQLLRERQAIRLKEELGTNPNVYYLL